MSTTIYPTPANTLEILAGDLLCHHATELLRQLAHANWEPARRLKEAIELYSEIRIGVTMAEGADAVLRAIDEKAPDAKRSQAVELEPVNLCEGCGMPVFFAEYCSGCASQRADEIKAEVSL